MNFTDPQQTSAQATLTRTTAPKTTYRPSTPLAVYNMAAQSDHTLQPHASQITRNVDGADDFVVVDFISREQQAPAITPGQYNFRRPVNPSTRVA
jgi:hypothetical protein